MIFPRLWIHRYMGLFVQLTAILTFALSNAIAANEEKIDANRITYLDYPSNPFNPDLHYPKLTTPQWIGEPDVDAAVVLAIDDMQDPKRYEQFLRPILERLKKIDGRAPVSIMTCKIDPADPQLQSWLKEGLSLEVHTLTHPCPLLADHNFDAALNTVHGCIDLMNQVPNSKPVAFRMPCCDSINSLSPRFFSDIFNARTTNNNFLQIDSSVFNIASTNDPAIPRDWTVDPDGEEKFRKYLPFPSYAATIDDYPYPYVIGKICWEFPCAVPSDWEGFHLHGSNNPQTVSDWKSQLDIVVRKQGVFNFVFHPHGWIRNDQIVEFIDYAVSKYGKKVKFLTFREAAERLTKNLLLNQPLRIENGQKNGIRLVDVNNDGFMDVLIGNEKVRQTRVWDSANRRWRESGFPIPITTRDPSGEVQDMDIRFGVVQKNGFASMLVRSETLAGGWHFDGTNWIEDKNFLNGLEANGEPVMTRKNHSGRAVRLRDIDNDGVCELIVANEKQNAIFQWSADEKKWTKLPFGLPEGTMIGTAAGGDAGLRFVDLNGDGFDDILYSNEKVYSVHLFNNEAFVGLPRGWSTTVKSGKRSDVDAIPVITRGGAHPNNGAWFRNGYLWVQNEDTSTLPDIVDRRSFKDLISLSADPAKSPQESLACMKARPGFKVELVASEPMIESPVAFDWGADGKLWVAEMIDYPQGIDGKGTGGGRVRFLEDTKGTGHYDKSTIFLDGLSFPNGVFPWRKGVLISDPPDIIYAEDTDGDGKADVKKVLFTGFNPGNPQHRANGFDYGLDNWLYGANGDSGGEVTSVLTGKKTDINGRDFRFRPDTGEFESESGMTQFGRHRDDWGNWFGNDNPVWLWHFLYPEHYLVRNPHLPVPENKRFLANYNDATRVFAISKPMERFNDPNGAEHVTSGNSPTPYRDELFGPDFATTVFASEPVHNVVHREVLEPAGVTFTSHRAADEKEIEFLASSDNWFRPTMTKTGPDGALYVADIYRLVIEHPEWIPAERQKVIDMRAGADKGRIYRVFPENATLRPTPHLDGLSSKDLAAAMDSANGWQRDTAQRLLNHRQDKSAVPKLEQIIRASTRPKARMQALCALDGFNALTPEILMGGLRDKEPLVRANAVRLCESFPQSAALKKELVTLANDLDVRVRYQLAFTLGGFDAAEALARVALKDWKDPHVQIAVMSSAQDHVGQMLDYIFAQSTNPPAELTEKLVALAAATGGDETLAEVLNRISTASNGKFAIWQFSALAGFVDALEHNGKTLNGLGSSTEAKSKQAVEQAESLFASAREIVTETIAGTNVAATKAAIRLLGRSPSNKENDLRLLGRLFEPQISPELQTIGLASLKHMNSTAAANLLLQHWNGYGPAIRSEVLAALLSRPDWTKLLLDEIESKKVPTSHIGTVQQQALLKHSDESVRERAAKLFQSNNDRQKIVKQYESVSGLAGNVERGHAIFRQNCVPCHRVKNEGNTVGPDLGMMSDKPVPVFLVAILDPNQAVEARYINYNTVTKDGREIGGVISTETANSLTLKTAGGLEETILRSDLKEMKSSGLSLMPEGFENAIKPQDMADLIAFLKSK